MCNKCDDRESQARELNQHRTRTIEVEAEAERLKRQLISERFERLDNFIITITITNNMIQVIMLLAVGNALYLDRRVEQTFQAI